MAVVTDPVCGVAIKPETAAARSDHNGRTYHFCSEGCKKAFDSDPERYTRG